MQWQGPILTDSGGFSGVQAWAPWRKDQGEGRYFSSAGGRASVFMVAGKSRCRYKRDLGSDIVMIFDFECTPYPPTKATASASHGALATLGQSAPRRRIGDKPLRAVRYRSGRHA